MPQEETRRGFSRTDNVTETLRRSLELFSNTTAVAREIEFTNKNISPEARTVLGWWRDTPVFVTYPNQEQDGTSKTIIQTVWNVTDLQNFSTTKFQNYLPRKMGSEVRLGKENQGDFYEWFDFSSSGMNDIKYTLVYLDGAVRPQGSGSRLGAVSNLAVAYTEPWSIFADGRFD
ncbi:hypothetical protein QFC21_006833 [Naganishia friedmannii]|uniref:Uncharacterized protein n=1 Tax=Naganishia friedmannii TaxID=89922 RepID=A0ACC2V0B1_9TREE|nr:hypothetical protein QFC21_006833 [Naganishia friedmannii]